MGLMTPFMPGKLWYHCNNIKMTRAHSTIDN
jgi:hypothetical protein